MSVSEFKPHRWWGKIIIGILALLLSLVVFETIGFLKAFELQFLDTMMALRGEKPSNPNLILITLDDPTTNALGSPLPRQYYSQLLRALNQYGAKTVVFDLQFSDKKEAPTDAELAALIRNSGHVIQPFLFYYRWEGDDDGETASRRDSAYVQFAARLRQEANLNFIFADSAILPHSIFIERPTPAGLAFTFPDDDGKYRRIPLLCKNFGNLYPALSLVTICDYLKIPTDSLRIQHDFWGYKLVIPAAQTPVTIPINSKGQAILNFYGPLTAFRSYSIIQILDALQDIENRKAPRIPLHDFTGKIVLIGTTETIKKDFFVTPFSEDFPGMGIHATAISNFLNGDSLRQWPWYITFLIAFILGAMLLAGSRFAGKIDQTREPLYEWSFFILLILSYNLLAYFLFFKTLQVAPAILSINSALALLFIATMFYEKALSVERLNRQVHELESHITAKDSHIQMLNTRIGAQDEQYKAIEFFISEIENVLCHPAGEQPRSLETPLMKMQLFKENLKNELERWHAEKQILETEKDSLSSQISTYKSLLGVAEKTGRALPAEREPAPEKFEEKFQEVNRVMESYKAFTQKAKAAFHYNASFEMVTAIMNGRLNGQAGKTKLQEVLAQIARVAPYDSTVLITGETGTGKELAARAIRLHSHRKNGPYVVLNCAAIPETLIESELFGHVKGAFTGALSDRAGAFEQANDGTIFLDEIGDLKPDLQAKLLRVLQEKKVQRLGSNKLIEVNARVIAATNRNLQELIQREQFRKDLYFRLDVANIHLPPLQERKEEVPHLVHYFLANFSEKNACSRQMTDEALMALVVYDWPGNIRELQHLVEKACINTAGDTIRLTDLPEAIQQGYRRIFAEQKIQLWEALETAIKAEMDNLLENCQEMLRAGNVEEALQSGELKLWGSVCENCYEYMKAYIDSKASSFPPEQREKLAKQTIVAMAEMLIQWCREQKRGPMQQNWEEIEKLLGRTRRMIDIWKKEVGMPGFYSAT